MANREFDNTNRGALFKSERKEKDNKAHEKWADYEGQLNVDGKEFWINAWIRKSEKSGKTFMSLSVKPKEERRREKQSSSSRRDELRSRDDWEEKIKDDIPF